MVAFSLFECPVLCGPSPPGSPCLSVKSFFLALNHLVPSLLCCTSEGRGDTRQGCNSQRPRPGLSSGNQRRKRESRPGGKREAGASWSQAGPQAAGPWLSTLAPGYLKTSLWAHPAVPAFRGQMLAESPREDSPEALALTAVHSSPQACPAREGHTRPPRRRPHAGLSSPLSLLS